MFEAIKLSEAYRQRAIKQYGIYFYGHTHCENPETKVLDAKKKEWKMKEGALSFSEYLKTDKI